MENIFYKEKKIFWYKYAEPSVYNVSGSHNYATSEFQWKIFILVPEQNNNRRALAVLSLLALDNRIVKCFIKRRGLSEHKAWHCKAK